MVQNRSARQYCRSESGTKPQRTSVRGARLHPGPKPAVSTAYDIPRANMALRCLLVLRLAYCARRQIQDSGTWMSTIT
eukprot:3302177-Rhodomonas_salina.1